MAAFLAVPTEEEYRAFRKVLSALGEGGIVVPPETRKALAEEHGIEIEEGEIIEYSFGGDADYWVDIAHDANYAFARIVEELGDSDETDD